MFLKVKNAESLLTLAGFQSRNQTNISYNMWQIIKSYYRPTNTGDRINVMKGHLKAFEEKLVPLLDNKFKIKVKYPEEIYPSWFENGNAYS